MRNCPRLIKDESGIALITALLILVSLTAIGIFAINGTIVNQDISANLKASKQGFYLAEAGFQHAKVFLTQNINKWNTYATEQPLIPATQLSNIGTYTVTIQDAGGGGRRVTSIGNTGNTSSKSQAVIEGLFGNNPRFPCAFCSQAAITLKGGGITDSFDSSKGDYKDQTPSKQGDVMANGNITISGNKTQAQGNAAAGGTVSAGTGQVTGTITNGAPLQYFPPVNPCASYSSGSGIGPAGVYNSATGQLQSSGAAITLDPGTYCFSSVQITGQGTLTVNGPVRIYVTADSSFAGNGIINTTHNAADLRIFSSLSSSNQGITLAGGSDAYAAVYAPNAYVKFTSQGGNFYGSVVGGGIDDTGGASIHYDLALSKLANGGIGLLTWREVF